MQIYIDVMLVIGVYIITLWGHRIFFSFFIPFAVSPLLPPPVLMSVSTVSFSL